MIDGRPAIFISYSEAFKDRVAIPFREFLETLGLHGILVGEEPQREGDEWGPEAKVAHFLDVATMFVALATPDIHSEEGEDVYTRPNIVDEIRAARERPHLRNRMQIFKAVEVSLPSNINPIRQPLDPESVEAIFSVFESQARAYGILSATGASSGPTSSPPEGRQSGGTPAGGDQADTEEGAEALEKLLALTRGEEIEGDAAVAARAYMVASAALAARRTAEPPGVHEINGLYLERTKVALSPSEQWHLMRAIVAHMGGDNAPGWYWLKDAGDTGALDLLGKIASGDSDTDARCGAIDLLANLPDRPPTGLLRSVLKAAFTSKEERVAEKALKLLAAHGTRRDLLALASELEVYTDQGEVAKARVRVLARESPRAAMRMVSEDGDVLDYELADALVESARSIPQTMATATLASPAKEVRSLGLRLLDSTSRLRKQPLVEVIENDPDASVRAQAVELALKRGWKLTEEQVTEAVKGLEWEFHREEQIFVGYYSRLPLAELEANLSWHEVRGYRVYEALSRDHFEKIVERIDVDLDEDFAGLKTQSEAKLSGIVEVSVRKDVERRYGRDAVDAEEIAERVRTKVEKLMGTEKTARFLLGRLRTAAMSGLAENGDATHLRHARRFLESGTRELRSHSLALIARAGDASDVPALLEVVREQRGELRETAAQAALDLTEEPLQTAKELIKTGDTSLIYMALDAYDDTEERQVFEELFPLLRDDSMGTRNVVTRWLIKRLTRRQLELLPSIYGRGQYYYSVQVLIDRALYAPSWARGAIASIRGG
jgi:hypothetical protein